jgi:hypothetical protein
VIASRPLPFLVGRPLGEEIKISGRAFYINAPSGTPQDFQFTTDEQSHLKVPIVPGIVYQFPAGFSSLWLFHANSLPTATDASIVVATGTDELIPTGAPAYAGSGGPTQWYQTSNIGPGDVAITPVPATGKRQRILKVLVNIRGNSINAVGGGFVFPIKGIVKGVTVTIAQPNTVIPTVAGPAIPPLYFFEYTFGPTGFVMDVGASLQVNILFQFTGGNFWTEVAYTEE